MIDIDLSHPEIAILRPEGALSEDDFKNLAKTIDGHINATDTIPNLVIRVDRLPHWDSIGALTRHLHFVKEHGKIVGKVAVVGDSALLAIAPEIANQFIEAKVRHFPDRKFADAKAWARSVIDDPGRFEAIDDLPSDVVAVRAVGVITAEDYRDMLVPLVEDKLKTHDKIKCLVVLDEDFATYSGDAAWADMKFGIDHMTDFERVALVTDIGWIAKAARLFAPLMPFAFKTFELQELEEAKGWIKR